MQIWQKNYEKSPGSATITNRSPSQTPKKVRENPQNTDRDGSNLQQRDFTLNMNKGMKKKLHACTAEYEVVSECKTGNCIYMLSAALYELYRNALVRHMKLVKNNPDNNVRVIYKDCTDRLGASVETLIKVYQKGNSRLKYSINLYHTQSKIIVNGRDAHIFI